MRNINKRSCSKLCIEYEIEWCGSGCSGGSPVPAAAAAAAGGASDGGGGDGAAVFGAGRGGGGNGAWLTVRVSTTLRFVLSSVKVKTYSPGLLNELVYTEPDDFSTLSVTLSDIP